MGRHKTRQNIVVLAVLLEFPRVVAFVPIEDQKAPTTHFLILGVLVKVLDPI